MAEKKSTILIRFPDDLANKLRRVSFEVNVPIKDIVSEIVEAGIDKWFGDRAAQLLDIDTSEVTKRFKKQPSDAFAKDIIEKMKKLDEDFKFLKKAAEMISLGALPAEALLEPKEEYEAKCEALEAIRNVPGKGRPKKAPDK